MGVFSVKTKTPTPALPRGYAGEGVKPRTCDCPVCAPELSHLAKRGAAETPTVPSKRQRKRKAKRGAAEDAESTEIGRGKTGFQTEDLTMSTLLKNQCLTLFLSPCSLRRSAAPGLFSLALAWRELEIEVPVGGVVISEVVELD